MEHYELFKREIGRQAYEESCKAEMKWKTDLRKGLQNMQKENDNVERKWESCKIERK